MNTIDSATLNRPTGSEIQKRLEEERIIARASVNEAVTKIIKSIADNSDSFIAAILRVLEEARSKTYQAPTIPALMFYGRGHIFERGERVMSDKGYLWELETEGQVAEAQAQLEAWEAGR